MTADKIECCMGDSFFLMPRGAVDILGELDEPALRVLLLLCSGAARDERDLCGMLKYTEELVSSALAFLIKNGILEKCGGTLRPVLSGGQNKPRVSRREQRPPDYSMEEISFAAGQNKALADLLAIAQTTLRKPLSPSDTKLLYSFCEYYGISAEAVVVLLSYCASIGKTSLRYIEKIVIEWNESGLTSVAHAEEYVEKLMRRNSREGEIRAVFGVGGRPLSSAERRFINKWVDEYKSPLELVTLAYDKTVDNTGAAKFSYADKILGSWAAAGFRTEADIAGEKKPKGKKKGADKKDDSFDLEAYTKWSFDKINES